MRFPAAEWDIFLMLGASPARAVQRTFSSATAAVTLPAARTDSFASHSGTSSPSADASVVGGAEAAPVVGLDDLREAYSTASENFARGLLSLDEFEVCADEFFRARFGGTSGVARAEPDGSPADDEDRIGGHEALPSPPPDNSADGSRPPAVRLICSPAPTSFYSFPPSAAPQLPSPARAPPAAPSLLRDLLVKPFPSLLFDPPAATVSVPSGRPLLSCALGQIRDAPPLDPPDPEPPPHPPGRRPGTLRPVPRRPPLLAPDPRPRGVKFWSFLT